MLVVDTLRASYGHTPVLFGVSFTIGAGEVVALLGRNGMGKTTTIRALMGLLPATGGQATFDGCSLIGLPRDLTLTLIEHDMDLALGLVDRVTCLYNGQVLCEGDPEAIRKDARVQEVYLGKPRDA